MKIDESEILQVQDFIKSLNSKKNCIIVVEGKKDKEALYKMGFSGKICQFHSFKGLAKFTDSVSGNKCLILLLDSDRKGAYLTKRILSQLEHRMKVDLSFRKNLTRITKGKIRHIEDLSLYVSN